jgi:alkylhydroperoxidase family enzyme
MAAHTALARQLGVSEELLDALYHIDTHRHLFTARELVALRFAEIMTTAAREVDEELWDELQAHFDDGEIVEIALVIGLFNGLNRFADALRIEPEPPARAASPPAERPEPPAPSDSTEASGPSSAPESAEG